jgi:hypothetical protein
MSPPSWRSAEKKHSTTSPSMPFVVHRFGLFGISLLHEALFWLRRVAKFSADAFLCILQLMQISPDEGTRQ